MNKEQELSILKLKKLKGGANQCPKCNKTGEFGSIIHFMEKKKRYLLCGWCGAITEIVVSKRIISKEAIDKLFGENTNLLRAKTHIEAIEDGSIDKMLLEDVKELIGFYEPVDDAWEVTLMEAGSGYTAHSQFEAQVVSSLEEIKSLLLKNKRRLT